MKPTSAPKKPEPSPAHAYSRGAGIGRGVLFAHLLLMPLLFSRSTVEGFEFVKFLGLVLTAILLLAIGACALPALSRDDLKHNLRQPLTLAGLVFVASALISTTLSGSPVVSLYGHHENFAGFVTIAAYFVLFVSARWLVRTPEQMRRMFVAVVIGASLTTAYGLAQALGLDPFRWENVSAVGGRDRPFSTFGHANFLGAYLVLALPLAVVLALHSGRGVRIGIALLVGAMVLLLVLTLSRAAWLGLGAAVVVLAVGYWFSCRKKPALTRRTGLIVAGALAVTIGGVAIVTRHTSTAGLETRTRNFLADAGRGEIWSAAWSMFRERPLTGHGPETFHHSIGRVGGHAYWSSNWGQSPARAHNELLHVLATQGALGLMAAFALLGALVHALWRGWRTRPVERWLIAVIAAALAGYFVTEMFGFTVIACGSLAVVLAALASRMGEAPAAVANRIVPTPTPAVWRCAQMAILAGCVFLSLHLVLNPLHADLMSHEAETLSVAHPDKARRLHEEAVRNCPRAPLYWNRLGGFCEDEARDSNDPERRRELLTRARDSFAAAIALEPGSGYHHSGLGRALGELARAGWPTREDAFAAFDKALALDPINAYFYVDASQAALLLGDADRAEKYVETGLGLYPRFGALRKQVPMILLLRNRHYESLPAFEEAIWADWSGDAEGRARLVRARDEVLRRIRLMEKHQLSLAPPS